ncbi:MAG: protein translocase subunit SecF [Acidobacteria bacterium]|nr:MAG: protein translocase subunit SecF [Acidobacteriota bacterium]
MQFLTDTNIDFMKYRKVFVWVSVILLLICGGELLVLGGLNLGIDFAGGTQMTVRLRDEPQVERLRQALENAGLGGVSIQRFGEEAAREVLIKVPVIEGKEEGSGVAILDALDNALNPDARGLDLNRTGADAVATLLASADPDGRRDNPDSPDPESEARQYYQQLAEAIIDQRNAGGIFADWQQVAATPGVSEAVVSALQAEAHLGAFSVLSNENVGPQIGRELKSKGLQAIIFSLLGMLAYIWYRFELRFGIGALVATFHDLAIVLGLYALVDYEFNLPTIAAFLTLAGYSVNDTVVIFDRVRENMNRFRRLPLVEVMNVSLNQTLARTILTSGTTLLAVGSLFTFGGEVIRGFAFVLLVGVIVGTYSSIFIACPFTLVWEQWFGRDAREARARKAKEKARTKKAA